MDAVFRSPQLRLSSVKKLLLWLLTPVALLTVIGLVVLESTPSEPAYSQLEDRSSIKAIDISHHGLDNQTQPIVINNKTVGIRTTQVLSLNADVNNANARIDKNTRITTFNGDEFAYHKFSLDASHQVMSDEFSGALAFEFGVRDQHLIFSKPVVLSMDVNQPDGTAVSVFTQHAGQEIGVSGLTQDFSATCHNGISSNESNQAIVSNGQISFATCGASLFIVRDNAQNITVEEVYGRCLDDRSFEYKVYWHDDTSGVSEVEVVNDANQVLAVGSASPITIKKLGSDNTTAFDIRVRDKNNVSNVSTNISVLPESCLGYGVKTFTSTTVQQFTVPNNVYQIEVLAIGGGGGGQPVKQNSQRQRIYGGGGGGGASAKSVINVVPGSIYNVKVGARGRGLVSGVSHGGDSYVSPSTAANAIVLAKGGKTLNVFRNNVASSGAGGGLASSSIGDVKFSGGKGGGSSAGFEQTGAGGGAGGYAGNGGAGGKGSSLAARGIPGAGDPQGIFPDNVGLGARGFKGQGTSANNPIKTNHTAGLNGENYGNGGSGGGLDNGSSVDATRNGGYGGQGVVYIRPIDNIDTAVITLSAGQLPTEKLKPDVSFTITFSQPVTPSSLICDDFRLLGPASPTCLSINEVAPYNATVFEINVATTHNGYVNAFLAHGRATYQNGLPTVEAEQLGLSMRYHHDNTRPSVTIEKNALQIDPDSDGQLEFLVAADENIPHFKFTCANVLLTGSATSSCTSVTRTIDFKHFIVNVNATSNGNVIANIPENTITDYPSTTNVDGLGNFASTSVDNVIRVRALALNRAPSIAAQTFSLQENSTVGALVGTVQATEPDEETLIYSITAGNEAGQFQINNNGKLTVSANNQLDFEGDIKSYSLTIQVVDIWGVNVDETVTLNISNMNEAPVISGTPIPIINEDAFYSFSPTANDIDVGDSASLVYSVIGQPSWLSINPSTGVLSGTPSNNDVGTTNNMTISVKDASNASSSLDAFSIVVSNVNDAPSISGVPGTTVNEGVRYSFSPTANDIDVGDNTSLVYSVVGQSRWLSINPSTGVLSGTPTNNDVGTTSNMTISVRDASNASSSLDAFSIVVSNVNDAPTISGIPATTIDEGNAYSFIPDSIDIDVGDTLSFSIENKPIWMSFNTTSGKLAGIPNNGHVGSYSNIVISVEDASGAKASLAAFAISVNNVNDAPTISGTPSGGVLQGEVYSFTPSANDIDAGDELTFSVTNLPSWLSMNTTTGQISGIPSNDDVGTFKNIVLSVTDNAGAKASLTAFNITVSNSNDAPVIFGTPNTSVNQDVAYSFMPTANDQDVGDTISFSIVNKPSWASFNTATGALTGTPNNSHVGTTNGVVISVTDSAGAKTSLATFAIDVVNVNDAPIIAGTPVTSVLEDAPYSFVPSVSDIDIGDTLTLSISNKPSWASFNTQSGQLSGTPTNVDVGIINNIVITVTDSAGATASLTPFNLEVVNVNQPPSLANNTFSINENSVATTLVGTPLVASDPDAATTLTYSITNGNSDDAFVIDSNGQLSVKTQSALNFEFKEQYNLTVEVSDSELSDTAVVTVNIIDEIEVASFTIDDIGSTNVSENALYQSPLIQITGEHIGSLTYSLTGDDAGLFTLDSATGEFSLSAKDFELPADSNSDNNYQVTLNALDSDGNSANKVVTITVTNYNVAPTIGGVALVNQTQAEDFTDYQLSFDVTDSDKDKLTLSLNNSTSSVVDVSVSPLTELSFVDYDNASYNIAINSISDQFGASHVQLIATDMYGESALKSFDIVIPAVLDFPNISTESIALSEDYTPYSVTLENIDFAGQPSVMVEVSASNNDLLQTVTPIVVPNTSANAQLTLMAKANKFGSGTITFTVKAVGSPDVTKTIPMVVHAVNDAPALSGTPIVAVEGQAYGWLPTASDVENDTLTFSASNLPPWASIDSSTGEITGTPSIFDANVHEDVLISVRDGELTTSMTVKIEVQNTNQDPVYDDGILTIAENSAKGTVVGTHAAQDVDRHALTYAIVSGNTDNAFGIKASGVIEVVTSTALDYESHSRFELVVSASDAEGAVDTATLIIELTDVNEAPVIEITNEQDPSVTIDEGEVYSFTPVSSDVDGGDQLLFSVTNKPAWLSFDSTTGRLSGISDNDAVGEHRDIVINVTDTNGLTQVLTPFNIVVNNINDAPTIRGAPVTEISEGELYSFIPTAADIDVGDELSFSIDNWPTWLSFDSFSGALSGTPENGQVGSYNDIVISVTDNTGASASLASFSIEVLNVNDAPTIEDAQFTIAEDSVIGSEVGTPLFASDIDANTSFIYRITSGNTNNSFTIDSNGQLSLEAALDFETLTTYTLVVEVSDGELTDSATVVINVTDVLDGIDKDISDINKSINDKSTSTITPDKYVSIGVKGVTTGNVDEVNKRIGQILPVDLPATPAVIQVIVDEINSLKLINEFSTSGGTTTTPTIDDLKNIGIKGVTPEVLAALNKALVTNPAERTIEQLKILIANITDGDSDNDGLPDELERKLGTSITDPDSPTLGGGDDDDNDGVTNAVEAYLASIGAKVAPDTTGSTDSDNDGLPDALEIAIGGNPLDANDPTENGSAVASNGLTNAVNAYLKSQGLVDGSGEVVKLADYDNDGISDALEITLGGNPLRADDNDVDKDGVSDFVEAFLTSTINDGADTKKLDLNANGLSDAYEVRQAATLRELQALLAADQVSDSDGDGISDAVEEFLTGGDNSESITPTSDSDNDGISDLDEINSGSNPLKNDIPVLWIESSIIAPDELQLETYFGGLPSSQVTYTWDLSNLTDAGMTVTALNVKQPIVSELVGGVYQVTVSVTRTINGQALTAQASYVVSIANSGDLAIADDDGDGVANAFDNDNGNSDKEETIPTKIVASDNFKMTTQNGIKLRLGVVAILAGTNGSEVTEASIAQFGDGVGGKVDESIALDEDFDHLDAFDYEALNLPQAGARIPIFIPLTQAIPENASLRKFNPTTGWNEYDVIGGDSFGTSSAISEGVCSSNVADYTPQLTVGDMCLLLQISDGGANDSDGQINGMIVDPVAISAPKATEPEPTPEPTPDPEPTPEPTPEPEYKSGTKGGSISISIFVLLGMLFMLRKSQSRASLNAFKSLSVMASVVATVVILTHSNTALANDESTERSSHGFVHLGAGSASLTPLKNDVKLDTQRNIAWQFSAGWQFNDYVAIEGYYADLDSFEISKTQGIDYKSLGIQVTGFWPIMDNGRLLAFVGASALDTTGQNIQLTQVEDNSVHVGGGFEYDWDAHWFSRIQWTGIDDDADMFTIHFGLRFGVENIDKRAKPAPIKPMPIEKTVPVAPKAPLVVEKVPSTRYIEYIGFDHDDKGLDAKGTEQVQRAIELMNANPNARAVLFGHTDNVGNSKYNFELSLSRANNIRDMLKTAGIDDDRIRVKAYGDTAPIASNSYYKGRVKNRRVEVMVID